MLTLSAILTDYGNLAIKRNDIAHNPLGWTPGGTPGEERKMYRMKREKVSKPGLNPYSRDLIQVEDIEALATDIKALVGRILQLHMDMSDKQLKAAGLDLTLPPPPPEDEESPPSGGLLGGW